MEGILELSKGLFTGILVETNLFNTGFGHYLLLAIVVAIEGPIATLVGAAAASAGYMQPGWVFTAASLGNISADLIWYYLGYLGKIEWLSAYGGKFGLKRYHLDTMEQHVHDHAAKMIFLAKLSAGFMIPTLIATGLAKVPMKRWLPVLLLGETLWTGTLVLTGYYATEAIKQVEKGVHYIGIAGSIIFVIVILFWILRRTIRRSADFRDVESTDVETKDIEPTDVRTTNVETAGAVDPPEKPE